jgi:oligopeptide transport system substrate-binding protein
MQLRRNILGLLVTFGMLMGGPAALAQQILRSGHSGEPDSLDPHQAWAGTAVIIVNDLFEGLLTLNAQGRPVAGIAESWEVSSDGLRYEFQLRPKLAWSDGTPLVAADVVYGLQRLATPATRGSLMAAHVKAIRNGAEILSGLAEPSQLAVTAPAIDRVVIELARPTPYFLTILALPAFAPVPRHVIELHGMGWTQPGKHVSNGAFMLRAWTPQEKVVVVRNPHFHSAQSVSLDEVRYLPLDNLNTGLRMFRAQELDAMVNFPPERIDWIRDNIPGALRLSPSLGLYVYVPNHSRPPFNNPLVRRALNMVLDRRAITQRIIRTGDRPAFGVVPPGVDGYFPPMVDRLADQDLATRRKQARQLLSEAGYDEANPLRFELLYHTSEEHKKVAIAAASMWRSIGVNTELINAERSVVDTAAKNGDFDLVRSAWFSPYADAYGFLNRFETGSPGNTSRYASPEFDELLRRANNLQDPAARAELLREAENLVIKNQAVIPIFYYVSRRLVSPRVRGWDDHNLTALHAARYLSLTD